MSVSRYNIYQNNMYFIGLGNDYDTTINPSRRFHYQKPRRYYEL